MAWLYILRRPHEQEFRVFHFLDRPVTFVDVGANKGHSVLSLLSVSRRPHRIVSFEANPENRPYLALLDRLLGQRFEYHLLGLGEKTSYMTLYVPVQGSRRITGEASFHRDTIEQASSRIEGSYRVEEQELRLERFDDLGLTPDIVKIDVQGHELSVLRGMNALLTRASPLFMIEENPDNDVQIEQYLSRYGYRRFIRSTSGRLSAAPEGARPPNWFYANEDVAERLPTLFDAAT